MKEKYGVSFPLQNQDLLEKSRATCLEKYGVSHPMKANEIKEKVRKTLESNGTVNTSKQQIACYELLKGNGYDVTLNATVGPFSLDILLIDSDEKIDIEYDGSYWHQDEQKDIKRDKVLQSQGYKILRIKAGREIPTLEQLQDGINKLINNNYNFTSIQLNK